MAEVHRATDLRLNRPVAVKIFRPGTDPDGERRFHEEAQMLANLSHPGLVAVHDSGVDRQRVYLVMELVDGQSLREVLDQQQLPLDEVARIGTDVADVLTYVHEQGIVHRDVKPSNVLLAPDGRVRLADFGISRLAGATGLTAADGMLGTAAYMAPEQVRGDRVGPPADVYALGLVLLEAVTGRTEYPGSSWEAASERLSRQPAVPQDLPDPLRRALLAMTEAEPARRPTAAQAAEMLAAPADAQAPVAWTEDAPPRRSRAGRNLAIAMGVFALIAILAALAYAGLGDDEASTAEPATEPTAAEQPADEGAADQDQGGDEPAADDTGGATEGSDSSDEGVGPALPDLPDFDAPDLPDASDLPDLPDLPDSSQEDARNLWERFTDWVSSWF